MAGADSATPLSRRLGRAGGRGAGGEGLQEQHLTIAREIGDRRGDANASWNLGLAYEKVGDLKGAAARMQTLVEYEREIGHSAAEKHAAQVAEIRSRIRPGETRPRRRVKSARRA